jgi:hypothetical protein
MLWVRARVASWARLWCGEVVDLECDEEGPQVCFDGFDAQMQGVGDLLVRCGGGVVGGVVERSAQFGQDVCWAGMRCNGVSRVSPILVIPRSVAGCPW